MSYTEKILTDLNAQFLAALASPTRLPWQKPWASLSPSNAITGRAYKGVNRFTLSRLPYSRPLFATFKQWQSLGHYVKKGEKGHAVLIYRPLNDDKPAAPATPTPSEGGKTSKEGPRFFLSVATVFNFEQLDPANPFQPPALPSPAQDPLQGAEEGPKALIDLLNAFLTREAIPLTYGGDRAAYSPSLDEIYLPREDAFKDKTALALTFAHECAHATGISKRLARYDEGAADPFGSKPYAIEELVAEVTASYAYSKHVGDIPSGYADNARAYVANWAEALGKDSRFLVKAFSQAEKALHWLETSSKLTYEDAPKADDEGKEGC